jgi:hypothetical protein
MIFTTPGIYSSTRRANSDALIIIWDSPQTPGFTQQYFNQSESAVVDRVKI